MIDLIKKLEIALVRDHYLEREHIHTKLRNLFAAGQIHDFVQLALGISDAKGNYSAAEYSLGPRILAGNREDEIFALAKKIEACSNTHHLPELIYREKLPYLKISVGSEIAMMLNPNIYWVGNVRTYWSYLLLKHNGVIGSANQELSLYRDNERDSEMDYRVWRDLYLTLENNLLSLGRWAADVSVEQRIIPGPLRFMWADAVANELYDQFGDSGRPSNRGRK